MNRSFDAIRQNESIFSNNVSINDLDNILNEKVTKVFFNRISD